MAKEKSSTSPYVREIQRLVNSDLQAVKAGNLDEESLRARVFKIDPNEPVVALSLWLAGLSIGLYDDLEISVKEGASGPAYVFKPSWKDTRTAIAPVLEFTPPGPKKEPAANPVQALAVPSQSSAAES